MKSSQKLELMFLTGKGCVPPPLHHRQEFWYLMGHMTAQDTPLVTRYHSLVELWVVSGQHLFGELAVGTDFLILMRHLLVEHGRMTKFVWLPANDNTLS